MKKDWIMIFLLWLAGIVAAMQFSKFTSTMSLLQNDIYIDSFHSGLLLSSLGLVGIIFGITSGVIVSRYCPVRLVVIFLWWASISSFLQTLIPNSGWILFIRILEGFSQLILVSAAPTALLKISQPSQKSMVMVLWGTFFGMAFLIMSLAQTPLILWNGWKGVFYGHSIFAALVAILLMILSKGKHYGKEEPTTNQNEQISFIEQHKSVYKERGSIFPGLLFACHAVMYLVFLTYLPQKFLVFYPAEVSQYTFLSISMPVFSLVGTFTSGIFLSKGRRTPLQLISYAFICMILFSFGIIGCNTSNIFICLSSLIMICSGILQGSIFATIPYLSDDATIHAYANGAITQMGNVGTTLGAPLFGLLLLYGNWNIAFLLPVFSSLLGISLIRMLCKKSI